MSRKSQGALMIAAGGLAFGVLAFWGASTFSAKSVDESDDVASPLAHAIKDPEPHEPKCSFWQPWKKLVAPGDPQAYLQKLKRRLQEKSTRSGEYLSLINREHSVLDGASEAICIKGRFLQDGAYQLDAGDLAQCETAPQGFLDLNMKIRVEKMDSGGFINELSIDVGMQDVTPEALLAFLGDELTLMRSGYRGWSHAFPAYYALNASGFAPVDAEAQGDNVRLRYWWQTQAMRKWLTKWSDYLMGLGNLVSIKTTFEDAEKTRLLSSSIDTLMSGIDVTIPPAAVAYVKAPRTTEMEVAHDITVKFRGLEIGLRGMKFTGHLEPAPGRISYEGRFVGVGNVHIGGAYRGLTGGSFVKMIQEVVEEKVKEELDRLTTGNRGKGWTFALRHETIGGTNVFTYQTSLQSPVNFLNLVREDKDGTGSFVLPDKLALTDLNKWSTASVDALIQDEGMSGCDK